MTPLDVVLKGGNTRRRIPALVQLLRDRGARTALELGITDIAGVGTPYAISHSRPFVAAEGVDAERICADTFAAVCAGGPLAPGTRLLQ